MIRSLVLILVSVFLLAGCRKSASNQEEQQKITNEDPSIKDEEKILGIWLKHPLFANPNPADTLYFTKSNSNYTLSFDCSGSPGPGWPSRAHVPYKFDNGKLSYLNYVDNSYGYFVATSFQWITPGKEFEIFLRHILLFMSATYNVRYMKIK